MTSQDRIRHEHLVDNAKAAINDVASDSNTSKQDRMNSLEALADEIRSLESSLDVGEEP